MKYLEANGNRVGDHHLDHFQMHALLTYHPFFPNLLTACFKLRLNEADDLAVFL